MDFANGRNLGVRAAAMAAVFQRRRNGGGVEDAEDGGGLMRSGDCWLSGIRSPVSAWLWIPGSRLLVPGYSGRSVAWKKARVSDQSFSLVSRTRSMLWPPTS